jgi:hypothetical protein
MILTDFIEKLNEMSASEENANIILNNCLDLMNELKGVEDLRIDRNFNLRLSMKPFSEMLIENDWENIEHQYWNDAKGELRFDLLRITRFRKG